MEYNPNMPLYGLSLNHIFDRMEDRHTLAVSYDKDRLIAYMDEHLAETAYYEDHGGRTYYKSFKKDSPLEMFNPPFTPEDGIIFWKSEADFIVTYRQQLQHIIQTHICV